MSISSNKSVVVRQVFAEDLDSELLMIKTAILRYPFVSIDTEFPGTIFKPNKQVIREGNPIINYHYMKLNVDALQVIQLGLSLSDAQDCYASDSIELLKRQGIDFEKNKEKGIDSKDFAKKFWDYGLLFNCYGLKSITWITFHGTYDFGFMLKILTQSPLPLHLHSFMHQLAYFFGYNIFDLKYTFKFLGLLGGLEKIAQTLNVARITGSSHQAGSDSLLTLQCFMKLKSENIFESKWNETNQMLLPPLALYGLVQTIG
ncbi:probable CCR4-associated factor 1 homolog 11 [Gossypium hirsutum]|uniref:poly(A)-specific ribonuclease n=1 Tax=Gossypium hirsutum TaxID=3635 RepID=A0ABM2ZR99_GOSHI|nr:probable CCR4-associated factor 1 homolog 11 [Gossypium hirsutum]